jgi:hypothetical protein
MGYHPAPARVRCEGLPGSPEKKGALAARILKGEDLWHDDDNLGEDEEIP